MNVKNNQRFQETDEKIQNCFLNLLNQKPISRITIREICDQVGINRSSFYAHYEDIYALLNGISKEIGRQLIIQLGEIEYDPSFPISKVHLRITLEHIKEHSTFYKGWLGDIGAEKSETHFRTLLENIFKPWLYQHGVTSDHRIEYHFAFFKAGFMAVVNQWLQYDCEESPEEMAAIILNSIREPEI